MNKQVDLKCPWLAAEESTAKVVKWLVKERDRVEIDQDIMVMLLDDSEFLLPSPVDGVINAVLVKPGELIDPDQVLAIIDLDKNILHPRA